MLLRERLSSATWDALVDALDERITHALQNAVGSVPPSREAVDAIANGFCELQNGLIRGDEVDYQRCGVPIAYTFKYFPQRVSSVLAALSLLPPRRRQITRILDIGSGTDASRAAIELFAEYMGDSGPISRSYEMVAIEPSLVMQDFARTVPRGVGFSEEQVTRITGKIDFARSRIDCATYASALKHPFDLVILSACLPYTRKGTWPNWNSIARNMAELVGDDGVFIIIEPQAKKGLMMSLSAGLHWTGAFAIKEYHEIKAGPDAELWGLNEIVRPRVMPRMNALLRSLSAQLMQSPALGDGEKMLGGCVRFGIMSWNHSRSEYISIGQRHTVAVIGAAKPSRAESQANLEQRLPAHGVGAGAAETSIQPSAPDEHSGGLAAPERPERGFVGRLIDRILQRGGR